MQPKVQMQPSRDTNANATLVSLNDRDANVSLEIRARCGAFVSVRQSFDLATGVSITTAPLFSIKELYGCWLIFGTEAVFPVK